MEKTECDSDEGQNNGRVEHKGQNLSPQKISRHKQNLKKIQKLSIQKVYNLINEFIEKNYFLQTW